MTNKINRKVEYALIALKHLRAKAPGELSTAKEISQLYGCPFDGVSRVMQILAQNEVLKSEQGVHGGYQITRDLSRLSFFELNEMILGPLEMVKCLGASGRSACDLWQNCNIVSPITLLNRRIVEFYQALPVNELLEAKLAPLRRVAEGRST